MSADGPGQLFQNSFYVGNIIMAILYGVELMLYFQAMQRLRNHRGTHNFLLFFSTVLIFCVTIILTAQCVLAQEMWVVHQDWEGGPSAYFQEHSSAWYPTWGSTAYILLDLMSDAVLIHRCWTIWCGNWAVIVVPCLLWLATLAAGILELYVTGSPHANFFLGFAAHVGLLYISLSASLNVLTTGIICGRIIYYGRTTRNGLGEEFASTYFTLASVIVESALPYTLSSIAVLVAFGMGSDFSVLPLSIYSMLACISPQLLILRSAEGKAWTRSTATHRVTTVVFAGNDTLDRRSHSRSHWQGDATRPHALDLSQSEDWKSAISSPV